MKPISPPPSRIPKPALSACFTALLCLLCAATLAAADLSGHWEFAADYLGDVSYARVTLKAEGDRLTGSLNELKLEGTLKDGDLAFAAKRPNGAAFGTFTGKAQGDQLAGTAVWAGDRKITWSARRAIATPAAPRRHTFEPTAFPRVFSDAIPPVLHVFSGDTVRTWTVDAGGVDSHGVSRSAGGNPQTGPFYVEGALPGDTLAVKLIRLQPNRDTAHSGNRLIPPALTPDYLQGARYDDGFDSTWLLDREQGVARLKNPGPRLINYTVRLQPMLGCLAVAPPRHEAFRTSCLGFYGGNLDFNQLREGVTVYLPVSAPGALLFVGDGHAAQGDGELTGDALETSLDLEFTVTLIPGQSTNGPRAENDEYLMAFGIANSLPEAVQSATTELARWLERDYKLNPNEAAMILGTALQYHIAEVADPQMHVVAKIRKDILAPLPENTNRR